MRKAKPPYQPVLTHPQRAARRRRMARTVARGIPGGQVAVEFKVNLETVREACTEHGVSMVVKTIKMLPRKSLSIVAELLNKTPSYAAIGRKYGVSGEWVRQLAERAAEAGIPVQLRPQKKARVCAK